MKIAARMMFVLAAISFSASCRTSTGPTAATPAPRGATPPAVVLGPLAPSPRLIVGRIIAVDTTRGFAFVELATDFPLPATAEGTELMTRTLDFQDTGRVRASRYMRGRTLGTAIVAGNPSPGDEVVWLAP